MSNLKQRVSESVKIDTDLFVLSNKIPWTLKGRWFTVLGHRRTTQRHLFEENRRDRVEEGGDEKKTDGE